MNQRRIRLNLPSIHPERWKIVLLGIVLIGYIQKIVLYMQSQTISRDSALYIEISEMWYKNENITSTLRLWKGSMIPFLPLYAAKTMMKFGVTAKNAGVSMNLVLGSLIPIVMYFITYNIIKKRSISLLAALLIALHPKVNIVSIDFQRDVFYLFFFGLFLLCIIKSVNWGRIEYFIGTGLVMSLCIISRAESLELIIIAAVSSVLVAIKKQTFFKAIVMFLLINIVSIICIYLIESSCGMKNYTLDYYKAEMLGNLEHESI